MKPLPLIGAALVAAFVAVRRRALGRPELAVGAVVVAGLLVYGTGLVELPNIKKLIEDVGRTLGPYTYLLVGVMAFLETGAFVGLLAPGETVILVGGLVAGQGEISIVVLIAIIWTCAVAGDVTSFALGRRLGRGFMLEHGPRVKITEERFHQVEQFFDRHGGKAILFGRFLGLVRAVAPFIAGSSGMPLRRFLPYDILGAGIWGATFALLGYIFWRSFDRVAEYAARGAVALGTTVTVVVAVYVAFRFLREPENRAEVHRRAHTLAERPALRPLARAARPVVWRGIVPAWHRLSGPLRFAGNRLTPGGLGLEFTTILAVLAVATFGFIGLVEQVGDSGPTFTDRRAEDIADAMRTGLVVDVNEVVTALGTVPVVGAATLLAVAVVLWFRHPIEAAVLAVGFALSWVAFQVAKSAVDRPRPADPLVETSGSGLPSGHATMAVMWVALAVALARGVPGLAGRAAVLVVALVLAAAVGLSRVGLRAHYYTDVVAGWSLGAAVLSACAMVGLLAGHLRQNRRRT